MARTETVTVGFTDLVGSTALLSRLGQDAYEATRRAHFNALRSALADHHGVEIKTTGDGLMLRFSSAADAIACAIKMQQNTYTQARRNPQGKLELRVGLSTGEASRDNNDLFGPPVVEAARLCAAASAGQILVSDVMRRLARGRGYEFVSAGEFDLKGIPEPVAASEVRWESRTIGVPLPPKLATMPAFAMFGREREQEIIARCWGEATRGKRQLLLIAGEPGIGKTRLAAEAARAAHGEDAIVMFGSCDEDISLPYRPFVEALRHFIAEAPDEMFASELKDHAADIARLVPDIARRIADLPRPRAAEAETERYLMFEAVAHLLSAASQHEPIVFVLDDLQWAGAPDLRLLKHIVRSALPMRVMIIATYRDSELLRTHPLTDLLADLQRENGIERMTLRGLSDESVIDLISAAAGHALDSPGIALAHAIHRETDGSPLFVGMILRNLIESGAVYRDGERWTVRGEVSNLVVPQGVKETIGRRLSRLSDETNKVLSLAAVIGREFDLALLARLSAMREDAVLDALEQAKSAVLVAEVAGEAERFAFTHALIRTTLYEELSAARRSVTHRRVGEALEAMGEIGPPRIDELAHHWLSTTRANDASKAIAYARRAAENAVAKLGFEEAVKYYEQALAALQSHDRESELLRCDLLIALSDAQRGAGSAVYRATAAQAVEVARQLNDPERLALAALGNARSGGAFSSVVGVDHELIALYEEALEALGDRNPQLGTRVMANLSAELIYAPSRERRHQLSREAADTARRVGDKPLLFYALNARAWAINDPMMLVERLALTAEMESLTAAFGGPEQRYLAAYHRAGALFESGDSESGERMITRMSAAAEESRQPYFRWQAHYAQTMLAIMRGEPAAESQVLADFQFGMENEQRDGGTVMGGQLFQIRWNQGRSGELLDALRALVEQQPHIMAWRAGLASLCCENGLYDEARATLSHITKSGLTLPIDWSWGSSISSLAFAAGDLKDQEAAAVFYPMLQPLKGQIAMTGNLLLCHGSLAFPCGVLAACLELWSEADEHFNQAIAVNERLGARPYLVRTRRAYAAMLLSANRSGDRARADEQISGAITDATALGMQRELSALNQLRAT